MTSLYKNDQILNKRIIYSELDQIDNRSLDKMIKVVSKLMDKFIMSSAYTNKLYRIIIFLNKLFPYFND